MAERTPALSATVLQSVLDQLSLAIFVFRRERLVYTNPPATRLVNRLRTKYHIELLVMLLDHLAQSRDRSQQAGAAIALTGHDNEPFVVHLMELRGRHGDVAVSIREIGTDISAFKDRYRSVAARDPGRRAGAPRLSEQPHRDDARDHAGDDQEAPLQDLREGRCRFPGAAGQQAGLTRRSCPVRRTAGCPRSSR